MFLLAALCLVATALAAPAITEAPLIPEEFHILSFPDITYPDPTLSMMMRTLDMRIEPEPKEEYTEPEPYEELKEELPELIEEPKEELPEPYEEPKEEVPEPYKETKEELTEIEEPKEQLLEEPKEPPNLTELPNLEAKPESVLINLDVPKPPSFISNIINAFPSFSSIPSYISNWFSSSPKIMYSPMYYAGYPGAVIVEAMP